MVSKPKTGVTKGAEKARKRALGGQIREIRLKGGHSRADLAKRVGVTVSALSALERGERWPSFSTFLSLAQALGVPSHWLLDGM